MNFWSGRGWTPRRGRWAWLVALRAVAPDDENPLAKSKDAALRTLVKTTEDYATAREIVGSGKDRGR